MKHLAILSSLLIGLCIAACKGDESAKEAAPAMPSSEAANAGELPSPKPGEKEPAPQPKSAVPSEATGPDLTSVHALIKDGKKLAAVREYRELHGKLALNASSIGVDVESTKLGLPSLDQAATLVFEGKHEEALAVFRAMYPDKSGGDQPLSESARALMDDLIGAAPATEENLTKLLELGKTTAALRVFHYLHPEVPIPDAWKQIEARAKK